MKKNDYTKIITSLRKNIKSPYLYSNYFLDYNYSNEIYLKFFKKISFFSYVKIISLLFKNIILLIGVIIIKSKKYFKKFNIKKNNLIIIGHRINNDINQDFYFFELIKYFKSQSIDYSLFQINHINAKLNPYLINNYMSLKSEILLFLKMFSSILILFMQTKKNCQIKENKIYFYLVILTFFISNKTLNNLRIPLQILNIINNDKTSHKIFITYEGYHWEKVFFGLIKNSNKKLKKKNQIFALQHSFISENNKNFFDFSNSYFNCDYLLSSGSILYKKVMKFFPNTINLGATKVNLSKKIKKSKYQECILFLPSSNKDELEYLFKVLLKIKDLYPNYKFIWRSHPFLLSINNNFFKKYPQIEHSKNDLYYDLSRSKIAFYSISSSIIKAVCHGVRPIYVKNPIFNIDPLEDLLNSWKVKINNYKNLNKIFNYENDNKIIEDMKSSSKYYRSYFEKIKLSKIRDLLDEKI